MDYDQVIMRLFHQLNDEQQKVFIAALKKAAAKDRKYQALLRANGSSSLAPSASASAEGAE